MPEPQLRPSLLILLLLTSASALADAEPSDGKSVPDDSIGIINLTDQDVSPELRKCLKNHQLGECLQKQIGSNPDKYKSFTDQVHNQIDDEVTNEWRGFMYNAINPSANVWNKGQLGISYSVPVGGDRIDMDDIAMDPNKLSTEKKLNSAGVWVKHEFEIFPQVGYGFGPGQSGGPNVPGYFGGMISVTGILRITKHHPMDTIYNKDFWGYARQDTEIVKQAFPMYFEIGSHFNGQDLLPGEGIELERYGTVSLGLGPNISLIGVSTPSASQVDRPASSPQRGWYFLRCVAISARLWKRKKTGCCI